MDNVPHDAPRVNSPTEPTNIFGPPDYELWQSKPLDYWHSLLIYHDGAVFYWQILNHEDGSCIQPVDQYWLTKRRALMAGMTARQRLDADTPAGAGEGAE